MTSPPKGPDPSWGLTLAIRSALEMHGTYVADLDARDVAALVDLHGAVRQAGRLLGANVDVDVSAPCGRAGSVVTLTARCSGGDSAERGRAEEGLRRLLCSVRRTQTGGRGPALVPQPRAPQRQARRLDASH